MKYLQNILIKLSLSVLFLSSCKKDASPSGNIILKDKPLLVIQSHIQGKWRLKYLKGGICGGCVSWRTDTLVYQFTQVNRIAITWYGRLFVDTSITWVRAKDTFSDSTFVMSYTDPGGVPYNYGVKGIYNDTLVLYDAYASDPASYHFTKF